MNCTSNTIIKKPDNLIPENQMVDLLTDLLVASGAENVKNLQLKRKVNYYPLVFEKYNIDSVQFKESNYYYSTKVDEYNQIIRKVETRLSDMLNQYEKERRTKDSLSNFKNVLRDQEVDAFVK
ncbi:DUF4296 domain-containing protein [Lutibacter sp.]|uniref:DUF4296 domain-containing protein n=1 Tax=Lutibacter sp. TaxID=1925666 RepID=UPI001A198A66|nr:DUF4296 domain-containing protein [Lutibacter sp.]MBI9041011.1 DUF4296 domain-containing protein [Lutibacter sp.]